MSVNGPNPEMYSSIYAKMTPKAAWERLYKAASLQRAEQGKAPNCLWLLRESSIDGCLTLTYIKRNSNQHYDCYHMRYVILTEGDELKWEGVSKLSEEEIKEKYVKTNKIVFMNTKRAEEEKYRDITKKLFDFFKNGGFQLNDYLVPSKQEESRNSHYECISLSTYFRSKLEQEDQEIDIPSAEALVQKLEEKATTECLITRESIGDEPAAILTTPHLYNSGAAFEWVRRQGSDPLTRAPIASSGVLFTHVCQHARAESERLRKAIEKRKNTQSDLSEVPPSKRHTI